MLRSYYGGEYINSPVFGKYSAEAGVHALFLFELYSATSNPDVLTAATASLQFVAQQVVPSRKWFTADAFFGASRLPLNTTDTRTGQPVQSNLGMFASAYAALRAYQVTKTASYLTLGRTILSTAVLTQSVTAHPAFSLNTFGGFGNQNTDAAWSVARQASFSDVLLQFYLETGEMEYLERGAAALRAALAVSPYASWARTGSDDAPGPDTSFHAGLGSAVASVEFWLDALGSALVVLPLQQSLCIDGCTVTHFAASGAAIDVTIATPYDFSSSGFSLVVVTEVAAWDTFLRHHTGTTGSGLQTRAAQVAAYTATSDSQVVVEAAADDDGAQAYTLTVNGHALGSFTSDQLQDGVDVSKALSPFAAKQQQ